MRYFIVSFIIHILAVLCISSSITGNSQQNYEVYFQTSQSKNSTVSTATSKQVLAQTKKQMSSPEAGLQNTVTNNSASDNENTQGIVSLNGQIEPTQTIFSYLVSQIYQNRIYPHESVRLKQQGQVTVRFFINQNGEITDILVATPSLHKLLNQAAVKTLDRIKINKNLPEVERLYDRNYSFTFDFEITKTSS